MGRSGSSSPSPLIAGRGGSVDLELDVDAAVLRVASLVGAGGIERATRRDGELRLADAELGQVAGDRFGATRAEAEVVLLGAARVGATDEGDRLALERTRHHAGRELLE